jgi:hypothetical protein
MLSEKRIDELRKSIDYDSNSDRMVCGYNPGITCGSKIPENCPSPGDCIYRAARRYRHVKIPLLPRRVKIPLLPRKE